MKIVFILSMFFTSLSLARSESTLNCSTSGDALDSVVLTGRGNSFKIEVTLPSGKTEIYSASRIPQNTLLGRSANSDDFGGSVSDAILLTINKNTGYLARRGYVYALSCR